MAGLTDPADAGQASPLPGMPVPRPLRPSFEPANSPSLPEQPPSRLKDAVQTPSRCPDRARIR